MAVSSIRNTEPFARRIQYFHCCRTVIDELVHHQWDEVFRLLVLHVLRIREEILEVCLAVVEVIRSETPYIHGYRGVIVHRNPPVVLVKILYLTVMTLNLCALNNGGQMALSIC